MKKSVMLILVVLAAMLLGIVAGASAESKGEYFELIDDALFRIEKSMSLPDNTARVQSDLKNLRTHVYGAVRFMTKNGEYDARLLNVVSLATRATEMTKDEDIIWYLNAARRLAYEVLLGRDFDFSPPLGDADCHASVRTGSQ